MNNNSADIHSKIEELKELVDCCPHGHNHLNLNCPFRNIRKLNDKNLEEVLCELSPDEVDAIIKIHSTCKTDEATSH